MLPLKEDAAGVDVAMADPLDADTIKALELTFEKPVRPWVAVPVELDRHLRHLYGSDGDESRAEIVATPAKQVDLADVERLRDLASEAPVIRLVNHMIADAVGERASDIHIEPYPGELRVRHRVDGVLRPVVPPPPTEHHAALVSRVKILAGMNIVERRLPQDGRCQVTVEGRPVDIRVSAMPTPHGEALVLRLLDKVSAPLELDRLGFNEGIRSRLDELLAAGSGLLLATGPTGSGKTTTLYAALARLNQSERKLVSVEDPVEYQLSGITQIQVKPEIGLGFAEVLRSVLRHDPDVIMVGEMRDRETAEIGIQAALTGHVVLSTLHTNDAASAITRLADMGVEPYLMTSAIHGVLAQRLVRTLCRRCREPYREMPEAVAALSLARLAGGPEPALYRAAGCEVCAGTGYSGRLAVAELLVMGESVRAEVLRAAEARAVGRVARAEGMVGMREDGLMKVLAGLTTLEEVLRVTREA